MNSDKTTNLQNLSGIIHPQRRRSASKLTYEQRMARIGAYARANGLSFHAAASHFAKIGVARRAAKSEEKKRAEEVRRQRNAHFAEIWSR